MLDLNAKYEVVIFSVGDTKAGTKMGKLQLKNLSNETLLNCILWEETLGRIDNKIFRCGNVVKITGGSYNEKYNNCLVSSLELISEAKLGLDEEQTEKLFKDLMDVINSFKNENLKKYVLNLLFENEKEFKTSPAAKLMHHNYKGGLLEHTHECVEIAKMLLPLYKDKIAEEIVFAACILHDFGKIYEYTIDEETGLIDYCENFKRDWITHSQWGFTNCMANGFPEIAKMIAAHHSRAEWGAIIDLNERDLDYSLYLLHHIDDLSAKYGKINISDIQ